MQSTKSLILELANQIKQAITWSNLTRMIGSFKFLNDPRFSLVFVVSDETRFPSDGIRRLTGWPFRTIDNERSLFSVPDQIVDLHLLVTVTYFVLSVSSRPAKDLALLSKVNVIDAHDECSEHRALPVLLVNWPLLGLYHVYHRSHCHSYLCVPRWIPGNPKACLPWKSIGAFNISELKKCQLVDDERVDVKDTWLKANRLHTCKKSDWWLWLFYTVKGLQKLIRSVVKNEYTEVSLSIHCTVCSGTRARVPPIQGAGLLPYPPINPPIRRITLTSRTHRRYLK